MLRTALALLLALLVVVAKHHHNSTCSSSSPSASSWRPPIVVVQLGEQRTATTLQFATAYAALALKFENQPDVELGAGFLVRAFESVSE